MSTFLSEICDSVLLYDEIEENVFDANVIIDKGVCLELYGNPDGKHSETSNGASTFVFIDKEITYGELLKTFDELGSVKDDTLTIRIVDVDEKQEREFCLENPISNIL